MKCATTPFIKIDEITNLCTSPCVKYIRHEDPYNIFYIAFVKVISPEYVELYNKLVEKGELKQAERLLKEISEKKAKEVRVVHRVQKLFDFQIDSVEVRNLLCAQLLEALSVYCCDKYLLVFQD